LGAGETVLPFFNLVHILNTGTAFSFLADAGGSHWPAFNLADTALCLGVLILLWGTLLSSAQSKVPP
jgi:signal peptidase II